jgi:hypothetical protein
VENSIKGDAYRSSHWDEPNVLAHIRTNDRVFPSETLPSTGQPRTLNDVIAARDARAKELGYHGQINFDTRQLGKDPQYAQLDRDWRTLAEKHLAGDKSATLPPNEEARPVQSLHLEEVQSDWHQEGRKQGYKSSPEANRGLKIEARRRRAKILVVQGPEGLGSIQRSPGRALSGRAQQ